MLKSIINGATTTPTQLAKEIVFYHGEYAVIALPSILGAAGMKATDREFGLVSEQVVKSSLVYPDSLTTMRLYSTNPPL